MGRAIDAGVLGQAHGHQQPWYGPGWFDGMVAWIDERLAVAGLRRRGDVRQVRSWARSALLTVDTDRGRLWAKQVPMPFAHEVAVTGLLSDLDPGIVPPLVAADPATGRLLMEDVRGPLLDAIPETRARHGSRRWRGSRRSSGCCRGTCPRFGWPVCHERRCTTWPGVCPTSWATTHS